MRILLIACAAAVTVLFVQPVRSETARVLIAYLPPKNPAHEPIYKNLVEHRVLETLRDLLSPFRLPKPLRLQFKDCDGAPNAGYEDQTVTVCYEFIADIAARAPQTATPEGITRDDAIIGTLVQVLLHETGHALFELLDVPIFGREEDAADQFAAYLVLQLRQDDARRIINGVAHMLWNESMVRKLDRDAFSNIHGLPAQRFFNLLCIAYGHHPGLYGGIVRKGLLPEARAENCRAEYEQVAHAMDRLIAPHIDPARRRKFDQVLQALRMPTTWR